MKVVNLKSLYIIAFLLQFGWETLLSILNLKRVRAGASRVPKIFSGLVDQANWSRSADYTWDRGIFSLISGTISSIFVLFMVLSGALGEIYRGFEAMGVHPHLRGVLYILAVSLVFKLVSLPFSLYSQFVIEERHGFNKMTPLLFLTDLLKGLLISAILALPLLWVLFFFMDAAGGLWWLYAFLFTVAFQLVMSLLYPLVIAPLFNKFTPLPEGGLKEKILRLASLLEFRTQGIFVMDGSRRSRHSNAYFTGLGAAKRIVLFDTLLESLSEEGVAAVLAHEIGHEKKKHLLRMLGISMALTLVAFVVLDAARGYDPLYRAFGFTVPSDPALLVILSFCSGPFTFFLNPLLSSISRAQEYEADAYAAQAGCGRALEEALLVLGRDNLSNLNPHPWYSFYHYSHPSLAERLTALRKVEADLAAL